jgi:hypothetical protein
VRQWKPALTVARIWRKLRGELRSEDRASTEGVGAVSKAVSWCVCALVALVVVSGAGAAASAPPPGTPDPSAIALSSQDFPGAQKLSGAAGGTGVGVVASYQSVTGFPKRYGSSKYALLISTAFVTTDPASAGTQYAQVAHQLSSKSGQASFVRSFLANAKVKRTDVKVEVTKAHALGVADASMETGFVFTLKKTNQHSNISLSIVALDRVIVVNIAAGVGAKVVAADAKAFASLVVTHASGVLVPISVAVPTVTGTAQQGQVLSTSDGTWGNTPTGYTYQWQDCDPTGTTCTPIAGATAATYTVQPTDVGETLRVQVTATNRFGSTISTSTVTAAAT